MNTQFPGRPEYTGPDSGWAGYVHDGIKFQYCWSFEERLAFIDEHKPQNERAIRRWCMVRIDLAGLVPDEVRVESDRLRVESDRLQVERDRLRAECDRLRAERKRLLVEGNYYQQTNRFRSDHLAEIERLENMSVSLRAERSRLLHESDRLVSSYWKALEAEVDRLVPDAPWNGERLVFPEATA